MWEGRGKGVRGSEWGKVSCRKEHGCRRSLGAPLHKKGCTRTAYLTHPLLILAFCLPSLPFTAAAASTAGSRCGRALGASAASAAALLLIVHNELREICAVIIQHSASGCTLQGGRRRGVTCRSRSLQQALFSRLGRLLHAGQAWQGVYMSQNV